MVFQLRVALDQILYFERVYEDGHFADRTFYGLKFKHLQSKEIQSYLEKHLVFLTEQMLLIDNLGSIIVKIFNKERKMLTMHQIVIPSLRKFEGISELDLQINTKRNLSKFINSLVRKDDFSEKTFELLIETQGHEEEDQAAQEQLLMDTVQCDEEETREEAILQEFGLQFTFT